MSKQKGSSFQPGTLIDENYEVVRTIALGSNFGYVCRHTVFDKTVLLKCKTSPSQADMHRFQSEAKIISRISHPNVLSAVDFGVTKEGFPFLVLEYVEGEMLSEVLRRQGPLALDRFRNLFAQACDALSAVHLNGIVHRNIKPGSFLLSLTDKGDERLLLTEFSVAKDISSKADDRLVLAGEVVGTPLYMSPEACMGMPVDHRADIYALGCCMYEAIVKSPPFLGSCEIDTMSRHISEYPRLPIADKPEFACMERVVSRCLEKKPEERFSSAEELKKAIVGSNAENKPSESLRGMGKVKKKFWPF